MQTNRILKHIRHLHSFKKHIHKTILLLWSYCDCCHFVFYCFFSHSHKRVWLWQTGSPVSRYLPSPCHIAQVWSNQACLGSDQWGLYLTTQVWFREAACAWALMYNLTDHGLHIRSCMYQLMYTDRSRTETSVIPLPSHKPAQTQINTKNKMIHTGEALLLAL